MGSVLERIDIREPGSSLPLLSVSQTRGVLRQSELFDRPPRADSLDTYKVCLKGDIVFNKMSVRAGALGVAPEDGLVTYHYEVMRPAAGSDPRYLTYLMKSDWFVGELIARERGIGAGDQSAAVRTTEVPFRVLRMIDAPIAGADEQRAIADYLDHETAKIDTLIAHQEALISTLRDRKDSAWAESWAAATQNAGTVPLRRVIDSIVDGPFGSSLTSAHYVDSGARVVRLGNIGVNEFRDADAAYISEAHFETLFAHMVNKGDVVIAGLGDDRMPLGRAAVVPDIGPALVKADCYRVRVGPAIFPEFLAWSLSAPQTREQFALLARGSTRARLNTSVVLDAEVPAISLELQSVVLATHQADSTRANSLIAKTEQFIALTRERRAALITAAVTGDVSPRT